MEGNSPELSLEASKINDTIISRYMPFGRFVDMCRNGLFVSNANRFDDRWEGLLAIIALISKIPDKEIRERGKVIKSNFFVSCWHKSEEESMAMWKLYGKGANSICVETRMGHLINCCLEYCKLHQSHNIYLTEQQYISPFSEDLGSIKPRFIWDYWESENINPKNCKYNLLSVKTLQGLAFKHEGYSYEKEIRLICDTFTRGGEDFTINKARGIRIGLSKDFFKRVILSPEASAVLLSKAKKVLDRYKYKDTQIKMSALRFDLQ